MSSLAEQAPDLVRAAGGVVWRTGDGGVLETAVVHRPKYDDWSLPKGKPEAGEHLARDRCSARWARRPGCGSSSAGAACAPATTSPRPTAGAPRRRSTTGPASAVGGDFLPNDEVDELRWLPVEAAATLCSYAHDRAVLTDLARTDVPRMPALLLVRHGRAGDRRDWDGPDERRPLDDRGRAQARRLAAVLPAVRPDGGALRRAAALPADGGPAGRGCWACRSGRCPRSARRSSGTTRRPAWTW